jgi:hypothetical protein
MTVRLAGRRSYCCSAALRRARCRPPSANNGREDRVCDIRGAERAGFERVLPETSACLALLFNNLLILQNARIAA